MMALEEPNGPFTLHGRDLAAGAGAGLIAGIAFAVTMKLDIAISGKRVDDFQLLGGIGPLKEYWRATGPVIHLTNSIVVGGAYSQVEPILPGPRWLRGLMFATVENILLWPIVLLLDRVHPAIRAGDLPSYNRAWPFAAESLRHVVYGAVLGLVYALITDKLTRGSGLR